MTSALRLAAFAAALAGAAGIASAQTPQGVTATEIVLGSHLDLTGPTAAGMDWLRTGMLMKIDEINDKGGIHGRKLRVVVEDNGLNPAKAVRAVGLANGRNPLCGDTLVVYLSLDGDVIRDVAFQGEGCAISTASASMLTEAVRGKTVVQARALFDGFHHLLTDGVDVPPGLGKLEAFSGVREFPVRVKCATLPWHTLRAALDRSESASTE